MLLVPSANAAARVPIPIPLLNDPEHANRRARNRTSG